MRRFVDDGRNGLQSLGLGENLVDLGRVGDADRRPTGRGRAGQIVHRHPIRGQVEIADDRFARLAQIGSGILQVRLLVGENNGHQRKFRLGQLESLLRPIIRKRHVQPLEKRSAPLGIGLRRVVKNQIMLVLVVGKTSKFLGNSANMRLAISSRVKGSNGAVVAGVFD